MRKLIYLFLGIALISCSTVEEEPQITIAGGAECSEKSDASVIGNNRVSNIGSLLKGAGFEGKNVDEDNITPILGEKSSRGECDTLLYIAPFENGDGYAIISAKPIENEVLAVVDNGKYGVNENPSFDFFIELSKDYVRSSDMGNQSRAQVKQWSTTKVLIDEKVEPRVSVEWGQTGIYGMECPNYISGCSNTAAAQALTYFKVPSQMKLTYRNDELLNLDWENIANHVNYNCNCDYTIHSDIAKLMRQLGEMSESTYEQNATSTQTTNTRNTLIKLGLKCDKISEYNKSAYNIFSKLKNNDGIFMMRGSAKNSGTNNEYVGHAWIVPGAKYTLIEYTHYVEEAGSGEIKIDDKGQTELTYLYINWGYDGDNNGYFQQDIFKVGNYTYDKDVKFYFVSK